MYNNIFKKSIFVLLLPSPHSLSKGLCIAEDYAACLLQKLRIYLLNKIPTVQMPRKRMKQDDTTTDATTTAAHYIKITLIKICLPENLSLQKNTR
jgi:hypothetical protein